jgi:hypothetical protein
MALVYFGFRDDGAPQDDAYRSAILVRRAAATLAILFAGYAVAGVVL